MKVKGRIVQTTTWAVLLHHGARRIWLPKGEIRVRPERTAGGAAGATVHLPRWLARVKGLAP